MKKCCTCKQEKSLVEFYKNKHTKDGYNDNCKVCRKEYNKNNKAKIKQQNIIYYNKWGAGIYAWVEKKTDKIVYIGETNQLKRRKNHHNTNTERNKHIGIFAKHNLNPNDYKFVILHKIDDETERKAIEKTLINTLNPVYNERQW